jgi:uncharacterized membrane protein
MRRAFAWLVLGMAIFMLAQELPRFLGTPVAAAVIGAVAIVGLALGLRRTPLQPTAPTQQA